MLSSGLLTGSDSPSTSPFSFSIHDGSSDSCGKGHVSLFSKMPVHRPDTQSGDRQCKLGQSKTLCYWARVQASIKASNTNTSTRATSSTLGSWKWMFVLPQLQFSCPFVCSDSLPQMLSEATHWGLLLQLIIFRCFFSSGALRLLGPLLWAGGIVGLPWVAHFATVCL